MVYVLSVLFLCLNVCDAFHGFHEAFASVCKQRGPMVFSVLTLVFGLVEYVLWSLEEEDLLREVEGYEAIDAEYMVVMDVVYYLALLMLFCASMANWPTLAYYLSEAVWLQAMLYMSLAGYLLLWICRKLRGSEARHAPIAWYKAHEGYEMVQAMMRVTSWLFLIFIVLFGCMTPVFGEGVRWVSDLGTLYAIGGYVVLSFAVMLTPLMPGSIIDLAGGFLFVFVLSANYDVDLSLAWLIAVLSIIVLHYMGACAQWFIGSIRVV